MSLSFWQLFFLASLGDVLLVQRHSILELLRLVELLAKKGLKEHFIRQISDISACVVLVVLEPL